MAPGSLGGPRAVDLLERALGDSKRTLSPTEISSALALVGGRRASALIQRFLDLSGTGGVFALSRIDGPKALPLLAAILGDPSSTQRSSAVERLGDIGGAAALGLLVKAYDNPPLRYEAAKALVWWRAGLDPDLALPRSPRCWARTLWTR
jgi:HEAT repeat protein